MGGLEGCSCPCRDWSGHPWVFPEAGVARWVSPKGSSPAATGRPTPACADDASVECPNRCASSASAPVLPPQFARPRPPPFPASSVPAGFRRPCLPFLGGLPAERPHCRLTPPAETAPGRLRPPLPADAAPADARIPAARPDGPCECRARPAGARPAITTAGARASPDTLGDCSTDTPATGPRTPAISPG